MSIATDAIAVACAHLEQGRPEDALAALGGREPSGDVLARSIGLIARGLILESSDPAEALRAVEEAFTLGLPLPVLLRHCGRFFKRAGRFRQAHHCYALLDNFRPGAARELITGLSGDDLVHYSPWAVRQSLLGPRPSFYGVQPTKAALARRLGPDAAAVVYGQLAGIDLGSIARLRVEDLHDHARSRGAAHEEIGPARRVFLPAPPEHGCPPRAAREVETRRFSFAILRDVVVSSKSNFLLTADRALLDRQTGERELFPLDLDVDPIVVAPSDDEVTVLVARSAAAQPPLEEALPLVGVHSYNFGHWLLEFLPRVWACLGRSGFRDVPILIDEQIHPQLRPALELFVGAGHPVRVVRRGEAIRVRNLWTCSMLLYFPLGPRPGVSETDDPIPIDADLFARLVEKVEPAIARLDAPGGPKRIYLSRKDSQHRRLVNRTEVEAFFAAHGFTLYDPGQLAFRAQLERIRSADVIVGPDGSALWLAFLARPGTSIGYLNNPFLEEHWWIAANHARLGHRLSILTGDTVSTARNYRKFSDYRIDTARLPGFLDELLAGRGT